MFDIAAASEGINTGGEYSNQMAALASMGFSREFEREAGVCGRLPDVGSSLSAPRAVFRAIGAPFDATRAFVSPLPYVGDASSA